MAGSLSDFAENELLDHLFSAAAYSAPATLYMALFTSGPNDAGAGTECADGNYARLAITNNATNFPAASGGAKTNGVKWEYPWTFAGSSTIVGVALMDASTSGNMIAWSDVSSAAFTAGMRAVFDAGAVSFSLT